ncbi:MAG: hypothetical protein M9894_24665 [Planctomycetes bacterium]|nr:hypothetical protein [Planctomycetota bacterium]
MTAKTMSAHAGLEGVTIELLEGSSDRTRLTGAFAHFDQAFDHGTPDEYAKLHPAFLYGDSGAFRLRVTHKAGRGRKKVQATWRTLWPEWDPKDDALPPEEGRARLEQRVIDQAPITLVEGPPGVYTSGPVSLVTFSEDRDITIDGRTKGQVDFPVQLAHPRGWVQVEFPVGKKVVRRSFPAQGPLKVLHVEVFICVHHDGTRYFDPQGDPADAEYWVELMRTAANAYASIGIDFNTFVPAAGGVTVGGYSFRWAPAPKDADLPTLPGDQLHDEVIKTGTWPFEKTETRKVLILRDGRKGANGWMWNEHDRLVRYPRAFPATNPKAVRVFITDRGADDSALGVAVPEGDAAANYFAEQQGVNISPAFRTCVAYVQTKKNAQRDPEGRGVARDRWKGRFGVGPTTVAHEVGHVLGHFKVPGGHSVDAPFPPFLMASSAGHGVKFRMYDRGVEARRRIYDQPSYKWRTTMQSEWYLT